MQESRELEVQVAPFVLDRFEVTSGRFYRFLQAYDETGIPAEGAGAAAFVSGTAWRKEWTDNPMLVPRSANSLNAGTAACGNWGDNLEMPMRCVNWYVAQAFCIWDGGRLPTEAEWTFAAMGGDEQRPYPWSEAPYDATIDSMRACYRDALKPCDLPRAVGSYPDGAGKWNTLELAGNVAEWLVDAYREDISASGCMRNAPDASADPAGECEIFDSETYRSIKGGSYGHAGKYVLNAFRNAGIPEQKTQIVGFRCVRETR